MTARALGSLGQNEKEFSFCSSLPRVKPLGVICLEVMNPVPKSVILSDVVYCILIRKNQKTLERDEIPLRTSS